METHKRASDYAFILRPPRMSKPWPERTITPEYRKYRAEHGRVSVTMSPKRSGWVLDGFSVHAYYADRVQALEAAHRIGRRHQQMRAAQ